jgi:penicillin-binding protein 1A
LGDKESGGHAALPLWIDFMKVAIADRPNEHFAGDVRPLPSTNVAVKTATPRPASQPAAVATPQ